MTARVIDLPRVRAALRALDAHVSDHPELAEGDAPERLAARLEAEERDASEEHAPRAERRKKRPASRAD